jgi:hypothetical protein
MKLVDLLKRVDELLAHGDAVLKTGYSEDGSYDVRFVQSAAMAGFRSAVLSFITRVYGGAHPHYEQFKAQTENHFWGDAERGIEILKAIRAEIAGGWLVGVKALVAAELFADFVEMAEHLLDTGYKDPAAVMIGSVLEGHLRQLCVTNGIPVEDEKEGRAIPRKADRLNADLAKAEVYSKLDQKQITAWLELRNNAAHGKYELYTSEQVGQVRHGVVEFMARVTLG